MEGEEWEMISDDAKDLISKLIVKDPIKRLLPDEVFEHKWIFGTIDNQDDPQKRKSI